MEKVLGEVSVRRRNHTGPFGAYHTILFDHLNGSLPLRVSVPPSGIMFIVFTVKFPETSTVPSIAWVFKYLLTKIRLKCQSRDSLYLFSIFSSFRINIKG